MAHRRAPFAIVLPDILHGSQPAQIDQHSNGLGGFLGVAQQRPVMAVHIPHGEPVFQRAALDMLRQGLGRVHRCRRNRRIGALGVLQQKLLPQNRPPQGFNLDVALRAQNQMVQQRHRRNQFAIFADVRLQRRVMLRCV